MEKQSDWDISVADLSKLQTEKARVQLIDVRELHEREICDIGGEPIPLGSFEERIGELDKTAHIVVHCRSGKRSARATAALRAAGFENAWNLNGGILAWIDEIDSTLTKY